jgi:hypothetical protein
VYCNQTNLAQSPINVTLENVTNAQGTVDSVYYDWDAFSFSFIPNFHEAKINAGMSGIIDYVFRIVPEDDKATKGFNGFWGSEPFKSTS